MSLPIRPEKTTAGIVVDPRTLERVVPSSRRQDGTTRKELKIRPGFTPQEDIGRFRSSRAAGIDAVRNVVPGSQGRTGTKKDPYAREGEGENPFKSDPTPAEASAAGKSKAQLKNERRREKKRTGTVPVHDTSLKWDEDEDEDTPGGKDGEDMKEAFERMDRLNLGEAEPLGTGSSAVGGGAPEQSIAAVIATSTSPLKATSTEMAVPPSDPPTSSSPTDPILSPPAAADIPEGAASLVQPEVTERDWKNARQPQQAKGGRGGNQRGGARGGGASARGGGASARGGGGRRGQGRGAAPGSNPVPATQPKPEPQPRIRKEVRVREGTAGGASSLADRVRGLLVANQEKPRRTGTAGGPSVGGEETKV